jgi:hypothetical protein
MATKMEAKRPAVMAAQYAPASSCPSASGRRSCTTMYEVMKAPKPVSQPT